VQLNLRAATAPEWIALCQQNLPTLLSDHAHCERKAAATALSFISRLPGDGVLVTAMASLAREESGHLARVHRMLQQRGWPLLPDARDDYVLALRARVRKGTTEQIVDELLVAALIELRSAERLGILAQGLGDEELRGMYSDLALAEAGHAALFVERARAYSDDVDSALDRWLTQEAQVLQSIPPAPRIHG